MQQVMLILHFIGLAMGIGTSFAFMFLGIASSKMEKNEGLSFTLNSFALSRMGHIGLLLLIVSGIYLILPHLPNLGNQPLLIAKLALVLLLILIIGRISVLSRKARHADPEIHLKKITALGRVSMLTGLIIIVLAVVIFG